MVVTLLSGYALVTSPRGSYRVNGNCECEAAQRGHRECKHRAAARIVELAETETAPAPKRQAVVTRSIESDRTGVKYNVVRVDGWAI